MRTKFLLVSLIALLALVLSACAPVAGGNTQAVRNLTVNGAGQVFVSPDIAYIYIGVHSEGATASAAVSQNNVQSQKVIDALKNLGVDEKDIRTTNFSIWPSQQYSPEGEMTGTTYMVDNTVYVVVRDLETLGTLIDKTVQAGANTINSIQFDVADKTAALAEARQLAMDNAKAQAKEIASAAGVSLGNIQSISYYDSTPYYSTVEGKGLGGGAMDGSVSVPINPGQMSLTTTVMLVYEIK